MTPKPWNEPGEKFDKALEDKTPVKKHLCKRQAMGLPCQCNEGECKCHVSSD